MRPGKTISTRHDYLAEGDSQRNFSGIQVSRMMHHRKIYVKELELYRISRAGNMTRNLQLDDVLKKWKFNAIATHVLRRLLDVTHEPR